MISQKDKTQIRKWARLRKEKKKGGKTYKEMAAQFGVSVAYIYEIVHRDTLFKYCKIHKRSYKGAKCQICTLEQRYGEQLLRIIEENLMNEIEYLSQRVRAYSFVVRRRLLVKTLRDKYGFTFQAIGVLLKRHHTTIMSYYYGK